MAFPVFPPPQPGDTYSVDNKIWSYDGFGWRFLGASGSVNITLSGLNAYSIGITLPINATNGDKWYHINDAVEYTFIRDFDSTSHWIEIGEGCPTFGGGTGINFPATECIGDVYEYDGRQWIYNGYAWKILCPPDGSEFTFGLTAPENPFPGHRWVNSANAVLYTFVNDFDPLGQTGQWVQFGGGNGDLVGPPGPTGSTGPTGPIGPTGIGIPVGGVTWQSIIKTGTNNFDVKWSSLDPLVYLSAFGRTSGDFNIVYYSGGTLDFPTGATYSRQIIGGPNDLFGNSRVWLVEGSTYSGSGGPGSYSSGSVSFSPSPTILEADYSVAWRGKVEEPFDTGYANFVIGLFRTHAGLSPEDAILVNDVGSMEKLVGFYNDLTTGNWRASVWRNYYNLPYGGEISGYDTGVGVTFLTDLQVIVSKKGTNAKFYVNGKQVYEQDGDLPGSADLTARMVHGVNARMFGTTLDAYPGGITSALQTHSLQIRIHPLNSILSLIQGSTASGISGPIGPTGGRGVLYKTDGVTSYYELFFGSPGPTGLTFATASKVGYTDKVLIMQGGAGNPDPMKLIEVSKLINSPIYSDVPNTVSDINSYNFAFYSNSTSDPYKATTTTVKNYLFSDGVVTSVNGCTGPVGITGTENEIEIIKNCPILTVGLPDNVNITGNLTVGGLYFGFIDGGTFE